MIAPIDKHDVASFRALLTLFGEVFAEEDEEPLPLPDDGWLAQVLADENFMAIVARAESGEIVGGVTLRFWHSYRKAGGECYLYDLGVRDSHRRKGYASRLLEAAVNIAIARGVIAMWVQAEADDEEAVAFYRTLKRPELDVRHYELID